MLRLGISELGCSSARQIQPGTTGVSTSMAVTSTHNARFSRGDLRLDSGTGRVAVYDFLEMAKDWNLWAI